VVGKRAGAVWLTAALLLLSGCGVVGSTPKPPKPHRPFRVLAMWAQGTDVTLSPLERHAKAITAFVPFFYSISNTGVITSKVVPSVLSKVRSYGIPVVPLFNTPAGQAFLGSRTTRLAVARHMASIVRSGRYQGADIDFEPAVTAEAAGLATFITELHDLLPKGSQLYLDTIPGDSPAYRYAAITPEVTGYDFMTYDEHDDGSVAGPVAATPWVIAKVNRLMKLVPANKILMGIAFYGYDWLNGGTHAITISLNYIPAQARKVAVYDAAAQEMHATYTAGGTTHDVWWETPQGINAKVKAAEKMGLQGVAVWRLGYQTSNLTDILGAIQTKRARPFKVPKAGPKKASPTRRKGTPRHH
jgi:spore germination protein